MQKSLNTPEQRALLRVLRELRTSAGLRQVEVAERLGVHQSFVSKYESGERRLDLVELREIADALDTNLSRLVKAFEAKL